MKFDLNSKQTTTGITVLLVIAIVFVVNYLVGGLGFMNFRVDLTEDKLYTLSDGTRNILGRLNPDKPVTVRFYVTTEDRVMPPVLKTYARSVQDLLLEFEKASDGKVVLEKLAPNPNTEDEDKAREDEVQGMNVNTEGDQIYLGIAVQCLQQKEIIPFLNPNDETSLEYNIARAINKVTKTTKTVVGVMSPIPVAGSPMFPFQQQRGQEPWIVIRQLRQDYEVRDVPITADKIDKDVSVLIVIHPGNLNETAEFAIDQYLLGGGKVIAFVDPQSWVAQAYSGQQNPMTGGSNFINPSSNLKKLFAAWGVNYADDQVVADMSYRTMMQGRVNPTALNLPAVAINRENRITAELQSLLMISAGSFSIDKKDGITATPLVESSEQSQMIDTSAAEKLRTEPLLNFTPDGRKKILALQLSGKFKTAFPDGAPKITPPGGAKPGEGGGAQDDSAAPKAPADEAKAAAAAPGAKSEAKPAETKKDDSLKESTNGEGLVVLVGDVDMAYDGFCVQMDRMTGMAMAINSNLPFVLNAVEILSGGGDLLQVRSRASTQRPFKKLDEMRDKVESQYRPKLQQLQAKLDATAQEISTLKVTKDKKTQTLIIDPQQAKKIEDLMATQASINKEIREIKKEQNKQIDWVENLLTIVNVFGMPILVAGVGVVLALYRRMRTAAR